jgi:hypothetical protein
MDTLIPQIRDDIIPMYNRFLTHDFLPVITFSNEQLIIINRFLTLKNQKPLINRDVDMMMYYQIFESMIEESIRVR